MSAFNFNEWFNQSIGKPIDVDRYYGNQCVDVVMSWSEWCFPPHKWYELIGYGNAKDLYANASTAYFDKIPYKTGVVPVEGDIFVIKATTGNPEGHTGVIITAGASQYKCIEQNGYNPSGTAYETTRGYSNLIGFLRPKGNDVSQQDINNLYTILDQTNKNLDSLYKILDQTNKDVTKLYQLLDQTNKRLDALEGK